MSEMTDGSEPTTNELLTMLLVQNIRMTDYLAHILQKLDSEAAIRVVNLHVNMETWSPLPYYEKEPEND